MTPFNIDAIVVIKSSDLYTIIHKKLLPVSDLAFYIRSRDFDIFCSKISEN